MATTSTPRSAASGGLTVPDVDVLIIGAGISGIGAACQLTQKSPGRTFAVLERREAIGGTWDLFRYPGIRCDSDMYTFGYSFRPWPSDEVLTDGESIRTYIADTADHYGVTDHIRFGHRVLRASWSTADACWTIEAELEATGESVTLTASFLLSASGYYDYDSGYQPDFPGREDFTGTWVHPQFWPEDLDHSDRKVVVIGSGATAVTLIPALAPDVERVTMLQRSPTYILTLPEVDPVSRAMRRLLPDDVVSHVTRLRNLSLQLALYGVSRRFPDTVRRVLLAQARVQLGPDVDMRHFTPDYDPWDQRLCVIPDGDLFRTIRRGEAEIATDRIDRITPDGILLESGEHLDADIIVSATGLNLQLFGGMDVLVDGEKVDSASSLLHRSIMVSDVPNMAMVFGYVHVSWTRKADLVGDYVCRVLNRMEELGMRQVTPRGARGQATDEPFLEMTSGYLARAADTLPKQGVALPWRNTHDVLHDWWNLRHGSLDDPSLAFTNPVAASATGRGRVASDTPFDALSVGAGAGHVGAGSGRRQRRAGLVPTAVALATAPLRIAAGVLAGR